MRPLEALTPIILGIYLLYPITGKKRPSAVGILPAFALVVLATHARIEGMRWQMIPLYAFSAVTMLLSIPAFFRAAHDQKQDARPLPIILGLSLLVISTALPILLPVPRIPAPSGSYQVGTHNYELTDETRKEVYSGKDEPRRFIIQVWYPSKPTQADEHAPWNSNADMLAPAVSEYLKLPSSFLDHLALIEIPAYKDSKVPPTEQGFPVILFSHGWNGFDAQNTVQALQLASHGYVVVGMQHTYGAVITIFEDGTIARNDPNALPIGAPDNEYNKAAQLLGDQWAGDMSYALDFLNEQNNDPDSPFYGSLDLSRVGVYGHSTGGGAAIQFCGTDSRCKAVLGEDPFMRPVSSEVLERGVSQPSFFVFSQVWADAKDSFNNRMFGAFNSNSPEKFGAIYIEGTDHYDLTDLPLLSPLASQIGLKGPIKGKRIILILNDYLLSFFDMTLKGKPPALFNNPSPYPEVKTK